MKKSKSILQALTSVALSFVFASTIGVPMLGFLFLALSFLRVLPGGSFYSVCGVITAAILKDCTNPLIGGTDTTIYVANYAEIASVTRNGSNPQIIEAFTMVSGKKFYKYEGQNNSVEPEQHLVKQKYARVYEHLIKFKIFNATPTTKAQLELAAVGRLVAIVENNWRNGTTGNGAFEVYGLDVGLEVENLDRMLADADTQGAFDITLKTPEAAKEGHLPATLFITSYSATQAVIAALIA